jgi:hypothetical protein
MGPNTGYLDTIHPWSITNPMGFVSKHGKSDLDNPTLREVMLSEHATEFKEAMTIVITALEKGNTWSPLLRSSLPQGANILSGT